MWPLADIKLYSFHCPKDVIKDPDHLSAWLGYYHWDGCSGTGTWVSGPWNLKTNKKKGVTKWKGPFSRDTSGSHRAGRDAEKAHGREIVWGSLPILLISSLTLYSFLLLLFINPSPRSGMVFLGQGFQSNKVNQRKMTEWKPKIERILMRTCLGSTPKLITIMCFSCSWPFGPLFMYEPNFI